MIAILLLNGCYIAFNVWYETNRTQTIVHSYESAIEEKELQLKHLELQVLNLTDVMRAESNTSKTEFSKFKKMITDKDSKLKTANREIEELELQVRNLTETSQSELEKSQKELLKYKDMVSVRDSKLQFANKTITNLEIQVRNKTTTITSAPPGIRKYNSLRHSLTRFFRRMQT